MSPHSICAVTADRAVDGGTSSAGRTISTTLPSGSTAVRAEADGRPVVLFAHSYGGLICTDYVLSGRPAPDLLVLSGPALDDGLPRWQHVLAPLIARIWPTLALKNAWGPDVLSRDPEVGRLARLDPGSPERMTVRLGAFGFAAQERVRSTLADAGRADARVPRLGRSPRATHGDRAVRGPARRHSARLPGASARDAQRAGGPAGGRRRHRVAARGSGPAAAVKVARSGE